MFFTKFEGDYKLNVFVDTIKKKSTIYYIYFLLVFECNLDFWK